MRPEMKGLTMRRQGGFTMVELLVVIAIIAVLIGLLFPTIAAVQNNAKKQENNTLVRGVIQSLIQASESRRGFFPGLESATTFTGVDWDNDNTDEAYGSDPAARYWILLDGNYTVADSLISPRDEKSPWTKDAVTTDNYSFAMLQLASSTGSSTASSANDRYRRAEWFNNQNPLAPIVSDRLIAGTQGDTDTYVSFHKGSTAGKWKGSVGHGDLSVAFESTPVLTTRIAEYNNTDDDDIFDDAAPTGSTEGNKNACMTYDGVNNPIGPIN